MPPATDMNTFLDNDTVAAHVDVLAVAAALQRALHSLAAGRAAVLARQRIDCGAVKLSTMGAIWLDEGLAGEKVYTTVDGRFDFVFNLFDVGAQGRGRHLASFAADALTLARTPALTVVAAWAGAAGTRKLALFGAGVQGRAHLDALMQLMPFEQACVVDTADVASWCAEASARWGRPVRQCAAAEALDGADVVVTATRSKQPLFDGALLAPGAFVAAVGTSLPTGRELDDATLRRARCVVVEWKPQSLFEAGEVVIGLREGCLDESRIVDLVELYSGQARWRDSPKDIVVFKSVGIGLADLAAASVVWRALQGAAA